MQANNEKVNYPKTQEAGVVQQVLASKANKTKWKKKDTDKKPLWNEEIISGCSITFRCKERSRQHLHFDHSTLLLKQLCWSLMRLQFIFNNAKTEQKVTFTRAAENILKNVQEQGSTVGVYLLYTRHAFPSASGVFKKSTSQHAKSKSTLFMLRS